MRVLVVGSVPPPANPRSASLLAEVVGYRRQGAAVEVLAPPGLSVAHRYLVTSGPLAALEIAKAAQGVDVLVIQLEPGFIVNDTAGRAGRAVGLVTLATALRGVRAEIVLRLHSMHDLPGGQGGRVAERLWSRASRIEVGDEETKAQLAGMLGELAGKVSIARAPYEPLAVRDRFGDLGADADAEAVTGLVRARAAARRAELLGSAPVAGGPDRSRPRVPLWEWAPSPGAGVPSWVTTAGPAPSRAASGARQVARAALLAAEARPLTRPLAHYARVARKLAARS
ncbi:MAG TPA: hypothetical protein VFN50_12940 [Acidimicrobiales bacterium]|nr:hypothetical protein [Acidimicrobiales bacterium]